MLGVVVPVHNEQLLLGACLDSIREAATAVVDHARVVAVVVLDACTDRSEQAARRRHVDVLRIEARNVGAARRAGFADLLGLPTRSRPEWVVTTDADSTVDPAWLMGHLDAYARGWDAVVGTVQVLDWEGHPDRTRTWFSESYLRDRGETHAHVHGAHLGFRSAAYLAVGGFEGRATGEDVDLVARLDRAGHRILRTRRHPVITSARTHARAPHGFAAHLVRVGSPDPMFDDASIRYVLFDDRPQPRETV